MPYKSLVFYFSVLLYVSEFNAKEIFLLGRRDKGGGAVAWASFTVSILFGEDYRRRKSWLIVGEKLNQKYTGLNVHLSSQKLYTNIQRILPIAITVQWAHNVNVCCKKNLTFLAE